MNNEEWLKWRNKGIGGSDCSAIIGLNPYMTNVELWEDKSGIKKRTFAAEEKARNGNKAAIEQMKVLDRGHRVEPLIRELFSIDHPELDVTYKDNDHFIHPEYSFLRGTVDGRLSEIKTSAKGILEIKHVQIENRQQLEKWTIDKMPQNYFCQVIHYLDCSGLDFAIVKARIRRNFDGNIYIVEREYRINRSEHLESIEYLRNKCIEFWNKYVLTGIRPPLVLPAI